jgi:hypothetical protein
VCTHATPSHRSGCSNAAAYVNSESDDAATDACCHCEGGYQSAASPSELVSWDLQINARAGTPCAASYTVAGDDAQYAGAYARAGQYAGRTLFRNAASGKYLSYLPAASTWLVPAARLNSLSPDPARLACVCSAPADHEFASRCR